MEPLNAVASVSPDGRRLRGVVRRAVEDHRRHRRGRRARHQAGQDRLSRHADGRRLRPARPSRRGIRPRRGGAVECGEEAGQGDVDARGRRPQRPLQSALGALSARRLRRVRQVRRVPSPQGLRRGDGVPGPGAIRTAEGPRRHRLQRPRRALLRDPEPARRGGAARERVADLEPARHRAPDQHLRDRIVHGRARAQARHRSGGVPARARQVEPARARDHRHASTRWPTGAGSATAARSASPT